MSSMGFDSLVGAMDDTLTEIFQRVDPTAGTLQVTIHSPGAADLTVPCIVKTPMLEEDYVPGSQPSPAMLILFVPASAGVALTARGNTATYGGSDYDIVRSDADRCGGLHLYCRVRTQPYDQ